MSRADGPSRDQKRVAREGRFAYGDGDLPSKNSPPRPSSDCPLGVL